MKKQKSSTSSSWVEVRQKWIEMEIKPPTEYLYALGINLQNIFSNSFIQEKKILVRIKPSQEKSFMSCLSSLFKDYGLSLVFKKT